MATAVQRYQRYVSHVGEDTRNFFASLDAQPEKDVLATLNQKGFGNRLYLVRIWMDFRRKIREESNEEAALSRINHVMREREKGSESAPEASATGRPAARAPVTNLALAFLRDLRKFVVR